MTKIVYNSSDDNPVEGNLKINGVIQAIPAGSTIVAFVQDIGATIKIINDVTILETDDGNDWPNGKIKGYFPKAQSADLATYDDVLVCVRATINGFTETFSRVVQVQKLL